MVQVLRDTRPGVMERLGWEKESEWREVGVIEETTRG